MWEFDEASEDRLVPELLLELDDSGQHAQFRVALLDDTSSLNSLYLPGYTWGKGRLAGRRRKGQRHKTDQESGGSHASRQSFLFLGVDQILQGSDIGSKRNLIKHTDLLVTLKLKKLITNDYN